MSILVAEIQRLVAEHYEIPVEKLREKTSRPCYARPRHVAMYMARVLTGKSYPQIGRVFGRDHATVMRSVGIVEDRLGVTDE